MAIFANDTTMNPEIISNIVAMSSFLIFYCLIFCIISSSPWAHIRAIAGKAGSMNLVTDQLEFTMYSNTKRVYDPIHAYRRALWLSFFDAMPIIKGIRKIKVLMSQIPNKIFN